MIFRKVKPGKVLDSNTFPGFLTRPLVRNCGRVISRQFLIDKTHHNPLREISVLFPEQIDASDMPGIFFYLD